MEVTGSNIADRAPRRGDLSAATPGFAPVHRRLATGWRNAAEFCGFGIVVLAVSSACGPVLGVASGLSFQRFFISLFGVFPAIGFLAITASVFVISVVFDFGFCRLIPAAVELKGGRWTKDQCGGVQGWRASLSGLAWADRRRSGWFRPPPHWFRRL